MYLYVCDTMYTAVAAVCEFKPGCFCVGGNRKSFFIVFGWMTSGKPQKLFRVQSHGTDKNTLHGILKMSV